jgi:hypothetical protein
MPVSWIFRPACVVRQLVWLFCAVGPKLLVSRSRSFLVVSYAFVSGRGCGRVTAEVGDSGG